MPRIVSASTSFPPFVMSQHEVKKITRALFGGKIDDLERLLEIFDNSRIDKRHFMMPGDWYLRPKSQAECNRVYQDQGLSLLMDATQHCLATAGLQPTDIHHVIFVSSTGLATPTLETRLINRLHMNPSTTRLPIWGLGCAAGAAGLSRAFEHCLARPQHTVLLIALECCSLTFAAGDFSKKNIVATSLFADGAAAALITGERLDQPGPQIIATHSHLFPDSDRIMGWDFEEAGMHLVLSPRLPAIVRKELLPLVQNFLDAHQCTPADLVHYITHPGGARVLDAYRDALNLRGVELELSDAVLRQYGNTSSVSILAVLETWLAARKQKEVPGYGLLSAFGPGFSAELLLIRN